MAVVPGKIFGNKDLQFSAILHERRKITYVLEQLNPYCCYVLHYMT